MIHDTGFPPLLAKLIIAVTLIIKTPVYRLVALTVTLMTSTMLRDWKGV